jgi:hypothetical protein
MAEPINIESVVDDLSKPENRGKLEESLNDAFKEATNSSDSKTDAPSGENKDAKTEVNEPSKQKADEANKKTSRIDDILADRNAAKSEAAEKQQENAVLTKRLEDLTKMVEDLKAGNTAERATGDDSTDDKPMTKKEIDAYLEQKERDKNANSDKALAAEKSISEEIQALEADKDAPHAKDYTDDIKQGMIKHPTMTAYAVYCMLVGAGQIPGNAIPPSNSSRTAVGNRSKTNLLDSKNPNDMSQAEALSFLKGAEKSGDLKGLI